MVIHTQHGHHDHHHGQGPDYLANDTGDQTVVFSSIGRGPKGYGVSAEVLVYTDGSFIWRLFNDETGETLFQSPNLAPPTFSITQPTHPPVAGEVYTADIHLTKDGATETYSIMLPPGVSGTNVYTCLEILKKEKNDIYRIPLNQLNNRGSHNAMDMDHRVNDVVHFAVKDGNQYFLAVGHIKTMGSGVATVTCSFYIPLRVPHIDPDTLHWFVGDEDTGVKAVITLSEPVTVTIDADQEPSVKDIDPDFYNVQYEFSLPQAVKFKDPKAVSLPPGSEPTVVDLDPSPNFVELEFGIPEAEPADKDIYVLTPVYDGGIFQHFVADRPLPDDMETGYEFIATFDIEDIHLNDSYMEACIRGFDDQGELISNVLIALYMQDNSGKAIPVPYIPPLQLQQDYPYNFSCAARSSAGKTEGIAIMIGPVLPSNQSSSLPRYEAHQTNAGPFGPSRIVIDDYDIPLDQAAIISVHLTMDPMLDPEQQLWIFTGDEETEWGFRRRYLPDPSNPEAPIWVKRKWLVNSGYSGMQMDMLLYTDGRTGSFIWLDVPYSEDFPEAPFDHKQYARQDGGWTEVNTTEKPVYNFTWDDAQRVFLSDKDFNEFKDGFEFTGIFDDTNITGIGYIDIAYGAKRYHLALWTQEWNEDDYERINCYPSPWMPGDQIIPGYFYDLVVQESEGMVVFEGPVGGNTYRQYPPIVHARYDGDTGPNGILVIDPEDRQIYSNNIVVIIKVGDKPYTATEYANTYIDNGEGPNGWIQMYNLDEKHLYPSVPLPTSYYQTGTQLLVMHTGDGVMRLLNYYHTDTEPHPIGKPIYHFTVSGEVSNICTPDRPFPDPMPEAYEFIGIFGEIDPDNPVFYPDTTGEMTIRDGNKDSAIYMWSQDTKAPWADVIPPGVCWPTNTIPAAQIFAGIAYSFVTTTMEGMSICFFDGPVLPAPPSRQELIEVYGELQESTYDPQLAELYIEDPRLPDEGAYDSEIKHGFMMNVVIKNPMTTSRPYTVLRINNEYRGAPLTRTDLSGTVAEVTGISSDEFHKCNDYSGATTVLVRYDANDGAYWKILDHPAGAEITPVHHFVWSVEEDRFITSDLFPSSMPMGYEFVATFEYNSGEKPTESRGYIITDGEFTNSLAIYKQTTDGRCDYTDWFPAEQIMENTPYTIIKGNEYCIFDGPVLDWLDEAPSDGTPYGRQDGIWQRIQTSEGIPRVEGHQSNDIDPGVIFVDSLDPRVEPLPHLFIVHLTMDEMQDPDQELMMTFSYGTTIGVTRTYLPNPVAFGTRIPLLRKWVDDGMDVLIYNSGRGDNDLVWLEAPYTDGAQPVEKPVYTFTFDPSAAKRNKFISDKPFPNPLPATFEFLGIFDINNSGPVGATEVYLSDGTQNLMMGIYNSSKTYELYPIEEDTCEPTSTIPDSQILPGTIGSFIAVPEQMPEYDGIALWIGPVISGSDDEPFRVEGDISRGDEDPEGNPYCYITIDTKKIPVDPPDGYMMIVTLPSMPD